MIIPPYLNAGNTIGIVSTARKIPQKEIQNAIDFLESSGFDVELGDHIFHQHHQFAGTVKERIQDFQSMLDNPEIKAIWCSRGGYGSVQILDYLNFTHYQKHPKWIIGYSDITSIHSFLNRQIRSASIHGTMPVNVPKNASFDESSQSLLHLIRGGTVRYEFDGHPLNRKGRMHGEIVGGNLSVLFSLMGSNTEIDTTEKILFLEDLDEYLYHIHRMMINLKRSGKLSGIQGLVVGGMTEMNDNAIPFGYNAEEIIREMVENYDFPVCFGFPAGHVKINKAFKLGMNASLHIDSNNSVFIQEA